MGRSHSISIKFLPQLRALLNFQNGGFSLLSCSVKLIIISKDTPYPNQNGKYMSAIRGQGVERVTKVERTRYFKLAWENQYNCPMECVQ
jgi:hypothetical protein